MIVKFNGLIEKRKKGCNCKHNQHTEFGFVASKMYILPSGISKTFYVNQPTEVSERDGQFLLSYVYNDANGTRREVFSKVE